MEEITGNSRREQGKIVAIIETLSWESVRQIGLRRKKVLE